MTISSACDLAVPFRKSSYSNGGDNCVEVGLTRGGRVAVRDSKRPELPAQVYSRQEWAAFVAEVRDGECDL